jgi:hypothetical protein
MDRSQAYVDREYLGIERLYGNNLDKKCQLKSSRIQTLPGCYDKLQDCFSKMVGESQVPVEV